MPIVFPEVIGDSLNFVHTRVTTVHSTNIYPTFIPECYNLISIINNCSFFKVYNPIPHTQLYMSTYLDTILFC